ncbi:MAG TPA: hypothetical protein VMH04_07505 [Candidatus Solibacter sp.]|nr:hypothetical protein [Candidatus Solibacter sp.]
MLAVLLATFSTLPLSICAQQAEPSASTESLTAAEIMARVAVNQDRSEELRKQYVYRQKIHVVSHKPGGKLQREETAEYDVTPQPEGTQKQLKGLTGRYLHKGKYETFEGQPAPQEDSLDGSLVKSFREDLWDDKTKDGMGKDLFPLTSEEQKNYDFQLLGSEQQDGRSVYHIGFHPKDKGDYAWTGEAYIDTTEFQPVRVFTRLSRRLPFFVRTLLGTDVPGLGFNVTYQREEEGVWFPATFGTEFRLHAVFFINRNISLSLENSAFERTHVESRMKVVGPVE